jgi:hypothetical protein
MIEKQKFPSIPEPDIQLAIKTELFPYSSPSSLTSAYDMKINFPMKNSSGNEQTSLVVVLMCLLSGKFFFLVDRCWKFETFDVAHDTALHFLLPLY